MQLSELVSRTRVNLGQLNKDTLKLLLVQNNHTKRERALFIKICMALFNINN